MSERAYQRELVKRIEREFPGCVVIENDPSRIQGIPDLLILIGDRWAMLEVKISRDAPTQPNQEWYVRELGCRSFCAFIFPEIEEEIFAALQSTFGAYR